MKNYLFSIFVRLLMVGSGFLVFLMSAAIFGAEGRGSLAFGTSLFATIGILLSLSLGRSFLSLAISHSDKKNEVLPQFLFLNFIAFFLTIFLGIAYWFFSKSTQEILTFSELIAFSLTSLFYVWSNNGHVLYSSFSRTKVQDYIILAVRLVIFIFLFGFWVSGITNLSAFIWIYSLLLFFGSLAEIIVLSIITNSKFILTMSKDKVLNILKKSWWLHLDFIAFNTFPLFLIVFSASYISKEDIGRANFSVQLINIIFLIFTTANLKANSMIAEAGYKTKIESFKKMFFAAVSASVLVVLIVYVGIKYVLALGYFVSFKGVEELFILSALAIPGYAAFQFLNPIWIEIGKIKSVAKMEIVNFLACSAMAAVFLEKFSVQGFVYIFVIFHFGIFLVQTISFFRYLRK